MKPESRQNAHIQGVIKDTLTIVLIFAVFYFIDLEIAALMSVICTAILLNRRIILDHNPGFIMGHHITYNETELIVPKGVDVFDISKVPTMDYMRRYTEVIRTILVPPDVLIIRFCGIFQIEEYDLHLLTEITARLKKSDIIVIFSDVGKNVRLQFREFGIEQKLGGENICCNVSDAVVQATKVLQQSNIERHHYGK